MRFVAAGMVLFARVGFFLLTRVDAGFVALTDFDHGIHLFFVISRFIMTVTASSMVGKDGSVR